MVFTGGDPLKRPDIFELLAHSVSLGLRTTITPSATPLLSAEVIDRIQASGVSRMAVSLDGDDAAAHDGFRRVEGSFARTISALDRAREIGLETQVNTTVTRVNLGRLESLARLVAGKGARLWSVFFLVATGRATEGLDLTAEEYEQVFAFLYDTARSVPFDIKTTEAQHYRRYVAQRRKAEGADGRPGSPSLGEGSIQRQAGINDGKGLVFISHTGDVFPSGFLPVNAGNVRRTLLADLYRSTPLFQLLRDSDNLEGKCGDCTYRNLCGGSRSRAFALTGNVFAEDPRCVYQPLASVA
jgi:radical SAM protein with 4Fe4S-binding SPASM domain